MSTPNDTSRPKEELRLDDVQLVRSVSVQLQAHLQNQAPLQSEARALLEELTLVLAVPKGDETLGTAVSA